MELRIAANETVEFNGTKRMAIEFPPKTNWRNIEPRSLKKCKECGAEPRGVCKNDDDDTAWNVCKGRSFEWRKGVSTGEKFCGFCEKKLNSLRLRSDAAFCGDDACQKYAQSKRVIRAEKVECICKRCGKKFKSLASTYELRIQNGHWIVCGRACYFALRRRQQ
jgi:hypothetical protein